MKFTDVDWRAMMNSWSKDDVAYLRGMSSAQNSLQYSQFYTTASGPALSNPISAPQQSEIVGNIPSTLYFGEQMQPVPYSQYQSNPAYTGANSLWIKGETAWTQYAVVPQGAMNHSSQFLPPGAVDFSPLRIQMDKHIATTTFSTQIA